MASTKPVQERVVDPFASTNSDVVNRLSELVTHNNEGMLTASCLEVIADSTSPDTSVIVTPGYLIKDDVLIKITQEHTVDFTDNDQWVGGYTPFPGGNCYVVLEYKYQKQRPAPEATIKILSPSQRNFLDINTSYVLLKVVELSTIAPHTIINMYDYDPEVGYEQNERKYIQYYAGVQVNLDTHDGDLDRGKIVYELKRNKFFFGYENDWDELTAGGVVVNLNTDSTGVFVGQLCYVDENRNAVPAQSNSLETGADIIVKSIGTSALGTGQAIVTGFVEDVPVEAGTIVYTGDLLYLSSTTPGAVTNIKPFEGFYQIVGRALSQGTSVSPIEMIFAPKQITILSRSGQISTWTFDSSAGLYYHDIDVADLDATNAFDCTWFDDDTKRQIQANIVEIRNVGDIIRVYFSTGGLVVNYIIQSASSQGSAGGGGGGGGGGTTDHSVLANLSYSAAGHTGFAPSPHGNADHSQTYITSTGVNFTNLNTNGSVGIAGTQVAFGNHTHPQYIDIPSGSDILFVEDTAQTGYTLITTDDDAVIYMTKGSAAGGDTGGTLKTGGTWTQPLHNHSITPEANHQHATTPVALSISQIPSHGHTLEIGQVVGANSGTRTGWNLTTQSKYQNVTNAIAYTGSGATHTHGNTGNAGGHDHTGDTGNDGTPNTWRPRGINVTRQRRI